MLGSLWILNHYAISPDMPGGTRHYDLGRELVKRGYEVVIFASGFDHSTRRYAKVKPGEKMRVEQYDGVTFVWINTVPYAGNDWRRVLNMLSYGWRVLGCSRGFATPDVVIGSSMHPFAALAGWRLAQKHRAKFIFEVRDLWPQVLVDMGRMREAHPVVKLLRALELFLYRKSDRIVILGNQMKDYITSRYNISEEKIVWIPNGVDLTRFSSITPPKGSNPDFLVMYLGAHSATNALHVLVEAAKIVQERGYERIRFSLVGDGPEKQNLMRLAREMGLTNIEFLPPVPKDEVPIVLAKADALVLTKDPTFGAYSGSVLKMFDYMASYRPVIFSGDLAYNPVKESGCGYTVPPGDSKALAEAVIALYEMPESERLTLGLRGRQYVEKHHSIEVLGEKLFQVITEVLQN
ncbi:glycosyltransferase family 4 protein [Thermanaeromonas sp. C210]|uniref:glycosyltransferase family 4 protein n=1 Tax=Thermanaeromonas sp. C210 TaxID=2731925 RepID=UPI00155D4A0C|nr:glycosyltransferase family 4 protein [Thermanaeromonas sp. C210]GFN23670.1 glycosyltransferase WbuB [Thermanaeromonas sp. C210]